MNWQVVEQAGLMLPGVASGASYGRPALKLNGKPIACAGRSDDHAVLMLAVERIDLLLELEPEIFFQTPHYVGWPCVLVRYAALPPTDLMPLLDECWERRATARQRKTRTAGCNG